MSRNHGTPCQRCVTAESSREPHYFEHELQRRLAALEYYDWNKRTYALSMEQHQILWMERFAQEVQA